MNDSPMNENNEPEISENLRRIVPDDLSPTDLVAGARGKRRRRNGVMGALAALALVAVVVPVALNLPNDNLVAEPAPTPSAPQTQAPHGNSVLPGARACYNDDGTPIHHSQDVDGPAEPGAVKAWLCGDYAPDTGQGLVGPHDPLTSGVDELLEAVQSEPEVDLAVISCPAEYNLSFNVVLEYEDGTRSIIGGDRHGCRLTYDGGVAREGGDAFYGEALSAWEKQRQTDQGEWVVPHICPGPLSLMEMDPFDAVQASVCGEGEDGSWAASYLGADLVEVVSREVGAAQEEAGDEAPNPTSSSPQHNVWLTLSNEFTDYQTLVRHEDGMYRVLDAEGLEWFWEPPPELSARLDAALAGAGPEGAPPAGESVEPGATRGPYGPVMPMPDEVGPWVSEGCESVTSNDALGSTLPNGELPDGANRIWLCAGDDVETGTAPPMEALVEPEPIQAVVDAFNDLERMPADSACTMELGPSWLVVHEYADGTKYTVKMEEFGCRAVLAGDIVTADSEASYGEALLEAWDAQRTNRDTVQTRPGPLCPLNSSLMPVDAQQDTLVAGVACLAPSSDGSGNTLQEKPLTQEILVLVNSGLRLARSTSGDGVPTGDALVLLNSTGDPVRLFREDDGAYLWYDGEATNLWAPEGEVVERLAELFAR